MALIRSNLGGSFRDARDCPAPSLRTAFARARSAPAHEGNPARLAALRHTVARLERGAPETLPATLPLGLLAVDALLPAGGLACGALHEIAPAAYGDRPQAVGFALAIAALAQRARHGPAVLVAARQSLADFGQPYGHGTKELGLDVARLILVETRTDKEALWALEETVKSRAAPAVVVGMTAGGRDLAQHLTVTRRLSLAAAQTGTPLVLVSSAGDAEASAALTRWRIGAAPLDRDRFDRARHFMRSRWSVTLIRCRNGRTGHWLLEWDHVAHRFHLAQGLADHAPVAGRGQVQGRIRRAG